MIDNSRCPNCENDIADLVMSVAAERQSGVDQDRHVRVCPYCNTELAIAVTVSALISRADGAIGQY